ncbi:hypothetical protein GQ53DRAFT_738184 [Thozetella sp. PMI_491]|nr:hypothetical protein GQ53DRAFT_738184 [Thozetella sp. PMI_491]
MEPSSVPRSTPVWLTPDPADTVEQPTPAPASRSRRAGACVICNKRKIRCNLSEGLAQCDNCKAFGYECIPHQRKRKRYSIECTTPNRTAEFVQAALVSQFGLCTTVPPAATPVTSSPSISSPSSSYRSTDSPIAYLGRSKYLGAELQDHEESAVENLCGLSLPHSSLSVDDMRVLEIRRAFDLPSRAICESLISTFASKCHPWMPVIPTHTLQQLQNGITSDTPMLLVQALLMAGSYTESSPLSYASTQELYNRAKVLFFMGYEKDPMALVTAVTILQYWNPSGPAHISIHNSSYWLRIGVGFVHQMGLHKEPDPRDPNAKLRRRIFWTLFSRDCLLSAGQGRPRAIHLEDCNIQEPSISNFDQPDKHALLFVAHVKIAGILGDLTQWYLRGCKDYDVKHPEFECRLLDWVQTLPRELQIMDSATGDYLPYDCDTRFLLLPYFTSIAILYKPKLLSTSAARPTIGSTLAASCVARIFEDALARNEVRNGVAMQAIYMLIAGICQLSNYEYPLLWRESENELKIINLSLTELSKTWQTAKDTLKVLQRLEAAVSKLQPSPNPPPLQSGKLVWELFRPFGPSFCSKLSIVTENWSSNPTFSRTPEDTSILGGTGSVSGHIEASPRPGVGTFSGRVSGPWSIENGLAEDGPQRLMTSIWGNISGDSWFSGEDWFLQDA